MLKTAIFSVLASVSLAASHAGSLLDLPVKSIDGKASKLSDHEAKAYLIVNTASKCGFTGQYKGLETLYQQYKDKGLVVAGFPCNQFGGQEPGSNEEIAKFCETRFDVSFPMFAKIEVNGDSKHPLYEKLTGEDSPFPGKVGWNFTKFLVDADGKILARFQSGDNPLSDGVKKAVEKALGAGG